MYELNQSVQIQDCLSPNSCFHQLQPDELDFINLKKTQLTYQKGENLFKQGAFAPYVIHVMNGLVKTFMETGNQKHINLSLAKEGDFLAFSTVFGGNVYNYSAIALTEATICMIDKEALKKLLRQNAEFSTTIISKNCRNESHYMDIIKTVTYKQMRGKLASTLLYLSADDWREYNIFQHLSRQEIADFATISLESTVKFLKEFEKEGIIQLDGKNIEVKNIEKLSSISRHG